MQLQIMRKMTRTCFAYSAWYNLPSLSATVCFVNTFLLCVVFLWVTCKALCLHLVADNEIAMLDLKLRRCVMSGGIVTVISTEVRLRMEQEK